MPILTKLVYHLPGSHASGTNVLRWLLFLYSFLQGGRYFMSEKEKIVALYVRVSTGYQVDKDSLPFQKKELKNYCEHVLHINKNRIEVFEDAGKSGKNTKRPAFERMMEKVKSGQVSHVIVYKIDRISRNLVDFSLMYDDFKYNNVTFISLNEQFDTSSAIGEAILKIILVFAELERKLTSERVTDVMIGRAQNGQWNGARVPYGWDWDEEKQMPVHSKKEAQYGIDMYHRYLEGYSTLRIARYNNEHSIPTKRGGEWSSKTVGDFLRNPMNKGDYRYNYRNSARGKKKAKEEVVYIKNVFPPLIDPTIFDEVNRRLDENYKKQNTNYMFPIRKQCNIFSGLIICGKCGAHYQVCRKDERRLDGFRPSNYVCTRKRQKAICDSLNVSEVKIGPFMINYIAAMVDISQKRKKLKDKKELEQLILSHMQFTDLAGIADDSLQETMDLLYGRSTNIWASSPIEKESQDNENKKNKLKENLQKTDRALERLKKAYLFDDDAMDEKEFLEMKSKLEIDRVKIENEIKDIDNDAIANNVNQIDFIKTAAQFLIIHKINSGEFIDYRSLAILDEESMKAFMNSVIDHIVVLNRQITEIVFKNGLSHKLLYR